MRKNKKKKQQNLNNSFALSRTREANAGTLTCPRFSNDTIRETNYFTCDFFFARIQLKSSDRRIFVCRVDAFANNQRHRGQFYSFTTPSQDSCRRSRSAPRRVGVYQHPSIFAKYSVPIRTVESTITVVSLFSLFNDCDKRKRFIQVLARR